MWCFWWFIAHVLMSQRTQTKAAKEGEGINTDVCSQKQLAGPYSHCLSNTQNTHNMNMIHFYWTCDVQCTKDLSPGQIKWASDLILGDWPSKGSITLCGIGLQQPQRESGLGWTDYCSLGTKLTPTPFSKPQNLPHNLSLPSDSAHSKSLSERLHCLWQNMWTCNANTHIVGIKSKSTIHTVLKSQKWAVSSTQAEEGELIKATENICLPNTRLPSIFISGDIL